MWMYWRRNSEHQPVPAYGNEAVDYHRVGGPGYILRNHFHPWKILATWEGGLASHGGAIGIIIAVILFSILVTKRSPLWIDAQKDKGDAEQLAHVEGHGGLECLLVVLDEFTS